MESGATLPERLSPTQNLAGCHGPRRSLARAYRDIKLFLRMHSFPNCHKAPDAFDPA